MQFISWDGRVMKAYFLFASEMLITTELNRSSVSLCEGWNSVILQNSYSYSLHIFLRNAKSFCPLEMFRAWIEYLLQVWKK